MKTENEHIVLPATGHCSRFKCSDCVFYNRKDYDRDGWCYCTIHGKYYAPDDITCKEFEWKK